MGLTWNERVHSVHGYKLLGERVWDALVIDCRAWDSTDGFTRLGDSAYHLVQGLSCDAPPWESSVVCSIQVRVGLPVCVHTDFHGRMCQNSRRPFSTITGVSRVLRNRQVLATYTV
jgi:hypothetical protein